MKLSITADAYAITSEIKVSDIQLLSKHNPEALKLKDEENKKDVFAIGYSEGNSNVSKFGITFGGKTRDDNGYATITGILPTSLKSTEAAKEYLADMFGGVIAFLNKLEKSVPEAVKKVTDERKKLMDGISVA